MIRFSKILIANRGEIASRIIRTTKQMGIKSLAVANPVDTNSNYIKQANEAIFVNDSKNIFLDAVNLVRIAKENGADAIHPGYGFLSENPDFCKLCTENGIKFIGPSYNAMKLLSSKQAARELAIQSGIPVLPGYNGKDQSISRLLSEVQKIGFPVLLKASLGGGGRGIRVLRDNSNAEQLITMCSSEAGKHFGDGSLIVEKYLPRTRHIEIQVFGDKNGNVMHFGERECSFQRNYQKIIEEAPCFYLTQKEREQLYDWALRITKSSNYEGAGTVEFLCDASNLDYRKFYFMEVNTRLQVEHLVTQCINKQIDLVEMQIRIAQGESLEQIGAHNYSGGLLPSPLPSIYKEGGNCGKYSMECRVYNEDPPNNFLPSEGIPHYFDHVQHSSHTMVENNLTPPASKSGPNSTSFDPMLLKVVTCGDSRSEVIERMEGALRHSHIYGVQTNMQLLLNALRMQRFAEAGLDSRSIDEYKASLLTEPHAGLFEVANAVGAMMTRQILKDRERNSRPEGPWSVLNCFGNVGPLRRFEFLMVNSVPVQCSCTMDDEKMVVCVKGEEGTAVVRPVGEEGGKLRIQVNDKLVQNYVYEDEEGKVHVFPVSNTKAFKNIQYVIEQDKTFGVKENASTKKMSSLSDIVCPMPGTVVRVAVKKGDHVKKGDVLLVIEAMKMEHTITATQDGEVDMGNIEIKQFFKKGQQIMKILSFLCSTNKSGKSTHIFSHSVLNP